MTIKKNLFRYNLKANQNKKEPQKQKVNNQKIEAKNFFNKVTLVDQIDSVVK